MKRNIIGTCCLLALGMALSCKKFVQIDPPLDQTVTAKVYANAETANAAVRGIYAKMMSGNTFASGGGLSVTFLAGRSSDEFVNQYALTKDAQQFSDNNLLPNNLFVQAGLWRDPYQIVYAANAVMENLDRSDVLSPALKQQLSAEAKFIRAFCYFYLTNLFGEVPLILTTDYRVNAVAPASSREGIFGQIIEDLKAAKAGLPDHYVSGDRVRANRWAAQALLARVYLYVSDWKNAELEASEVMAQEGMYRLKTDLNTVFLKNSTEAILQFYVPATSFVNTNEGSLFILTDPPSIFSEVVLSDELRAAFEPGDLRHDKWVGVFRSGGSSWYFPYKYKVQFGASPLNEYSMVLRLAEMYLIRAESRINEGMISQGIDDLNVLRSRARALPTQDVPDPLPALSHDLAKADALLAVEQERRVELFSEWAHRWLDLKRTGRAGAVLGPLKGANWQNSDLLYPIPASELLNDPNLKQNPGYE